jgi:hypothetical protein
MRKHVRAPPHRNVVPTEFHSDGLHRNAVL